MFNRSINHLKITYFQIILDKYSTTVSKRSYLAINLYRIIMV
ncbi:hypothetical protein EMIT036CA2_20384 [Chryseobacterium sp. IT-36CA2]